MVNREHVGVETLVLNRFIPPKITSFDDLLATLRRNKLTSSAASLAPNTRCQPASSGWSGLLAWPNRIFATRDPSNLAGGAENRRRWSQSCGRPDCQSYYTEFGIRLWPPNVSSDTSGRGSSCEMSLQHIGFPFLMLQHRLRNRMLRQGCTSMHFCNPAELD